MAKITVVLEISMMYLVQFTDLLLFQMHDKYEI